MTGMNLVQKFPEAVCERMHEDVHGGICFDFAADDWFLPEYASKYNRHETKKIHIGFSKIDSPAVRLVVKQYAAWRLGRVKPVTVRTELDSRLVWWVRYLEYRQMSDPAYFDAGQMCRFPVWLKKRGVQTEAVSRIACSVVLLIETGQRLGWRVTKEPVRGYAGYHPVSGAVENTKTAGEEPADELSVAVRKAGDAMRPARVSGAANSRVCARPIPDGIYDQILFHAICDEKDIITKAGILIQSQTGLRIGEVLSLKENCLYADERGGFLLGYESKKTQRAEPLLRLIPANALVCEAVEELAGATARLRAESGRQELFLVRNHGIRPASAANWNRGRLRGFLRRWSITAPDGGEYPLHSHQFRATFVRNALLAGTGIETLRQQFDHVSSEMTAQYVHIEAEELAALLASCIDWKGGDGIG